AIRDLRLEQLLDHLAQTELRERGALLAGFDRVHQLLDPLARPLGRGYSRSHGDASSPPAPTGVSRFRSPMRLHPPPPLQQVSDITCDGYSGTGAGWPPFLQSVGKNHR